MVSLDVWVIWLYTLRQHSIRFDKTPLVVRVAFGKLSLPVHSLRHLLHPLRKCINLREYVHLLWTAEVF